MVNWCHAYGIATSYALHMNAKKWQGLCTNDCGREIKSSATKYCSPTCQHDFIFRSRITILEQGQYPGATTSVFLRKYLVHSRGEACSRCGWNKRHPVTGRVVVEVEHIDGDWRNNKPDNLTLLCPNCHAMTSTFRALNKGRGGGWRNGGSLSADIGNSRGETAVTLVSRPKQGCIENGQPEQLFRFADVAQWRQHEFCKLASPWVRFPPSAYASLTPMSFRMPIYSSSPPERALEFTAKL